MAKYPPCEAKAVYIKKGKLATHNPRNEEVCHIPVPPDTCKAGATNLPDKAFYCNGFALQ